MTLISFTQSLWMFLHMIGFGLLAAILIGSLVAERHLRQSTDWSQRMRIGLFTRNLGMLSPIASGLLLISGIGNMATFGYTMGQAFSGAATWLGVKIVLFFAAVIIGSVFNIAMGKKRAAIGATVRGGGSSEQGEAALRGTYGAMNMVFVIQCVLFLSILFLVMFRPV